MRKKRISVLLLLVCLIPLRNSIGQEGEEYRLQMIISSTAGEPLNNEHYVVRPLVGLPINGSAEGGDYVLANGWIPSSVSDTDSIYLPLVR